MKLLEHGDTTTHVVSFSGGSTSAFLVRMMEDIRLLNGIDVRYIFMDTGAEHPATYDFIRAVAANWRIDLVCLRVVVDPVLGNANGYRVVPLAEIGPDLQLWRDILQKYGTPYLHGAFCTRTLKIEPFDRYCKENIGPIVKWIGIRADEPRRLKPKDGVRYLADISEFEKSDILEWWSKQPFKLQLPEHLGNCIFCIKKRPNKIALAARDEPERAAEFAAVINDPSVRKVERRQQESKIMYRDNHSLESIIAIFSDYSREEIAATIKAMRGYDAGSCSESCEAI